MDGPLKDIKVLDLSRVLAGPSATQLLGDMGADIVKVEQSKVGDDTRTFGPPYLKDKKGNETHESPFYLSTNRNKRSIALNFKNPEDLLLLKQMAAKADVIVENFKAGRIEKFGLDYERVKKYNPRVVYCSITGFGQTGPDADHPGYDFLIQARGGIMSVTGEADGTPQKVGVGIADLMTGMYAGNAILAALYEREKSGEGQYIDLALLDCQVAWLSYVGQYYLTSGKTPPRQGNTHATIVPYQSFKTADGYLVIGIANNKQFEAFCGFCQAEEIARNPLFKTNQDRVKNRDILIPQIEPIVEQKDSAFWLNHLNEIGVPCCPINTIPEIFDDPQIKHRKMKIKMKHKATDQQIDLIGNPIKFSRTPVSYRYAPPTLNENEEEILNDWLKA